MQSAPAPRSAPVPRKDLGRHRTGVAIDVEHSTLDEGVIRALAEASDALEIEP